MGDHSLALPNGWKWARLGELGVVSGGGTPSTKVPEYWGGDIHWVVPSEVSRSETLYISATQRKITEKGLADSASRLQPIGTVMMTSRATIGDVAINAVPMATNQGFINIICDESLVSNEFLAYWIRRNKQIFVDRAHGVTFKEITKSNFKPISICLPPLPEQRAIAHTLRAVQQAKDARQRELTVERERKATLMEHLFTHGTRGEPCKQTEIGLMPDSWGVVKLGELVNLITKGASPKWQGFDYRDAGVAFVRSQNIGWGRMELDELAYLPEAFNRKERKSIIKRNDLLINLVGASIGRAAVATEQIEGGNLNQAVAIVRLKEDYNPHFGMYFILTESGQVQLHKFEKDIARANVSLDDINNYLVPFTNVEDQERVVHVLRKTDVKIDALEREVRSLDELFHAMLDELMTGRLSVRDLNGGKE
jgi:type I restriction enzyme, S subunit